MNRRSERWPKGSGVLKSDRSQVTGAIKLSKYEVKLGLCSTSDMSLSPVVDAQKPEKAMFMKPAILDMAHLNLFQRKTHLRPNATESEAGGIRRETDKITLGESIPFAFFC